MVTQAAVAAHLDLSQQAVSQLIAAGILPKPETRAGLDLQVCRVAYVRHLREVAAGRAPDTTTEEGLDLVVERARLARAQADGQEMRNAAARGRLIDPEQAEAEYGAVLDAVRTAYLALPKRAAPILIGAKDISHIAQVLTAMVHEILNDLARTTFEVADGRLVKQSQARGADA